MQKTPYLKNSTSILKESFIKSKNKVGEMDPQITDGKNLKINFCLKYL